MSSDLVKTKGQDINIVEYSDHSILKLLVEKKFLANISAKMSYVAFAGLRVCFFLMTTVPFLTYHISHFSVPEEAQM